MSSRESQAQQLRDLHVKGDPLVLYNIWDAGGAKALVEAGARAVGTGSWSMAAAHGFEDGEAIPLDLVLQIVGRITETVSCPVTVDFEGGFAEAPEKIGENVARLIAAGAVGLNFEDQVVKGPGLNSITAQCARIAAIRKAAEAEGVAVFLNARTDVFLKAPEGSDPEALMDEALARQAAYGDAGADGFFVPGLTDPALIRTVCEASSLPVNVMMFGNLASVSEVAALGVARASYGPGPYAAAMADLARRQQDAMAS